MSTWTADEWIAQHGANAYREAVRMTVVGVNLGDMRGAEMFAAIGRELCARGLHEKTNPDLSDEPLHLKG